MFQIMKCRDVECVVCSPPRLPDDIFEELHFIPAPLFDASKEHFQKFSAVYGSKTTEKDMRSLKFTLEASVEDKENKSILVSQNVRATVSCNACQRPRCVYSSSKMTCGMREDLNVVLENGEYLCGGSLVRDDNPRRQQFVVCRQLACHMPMEVTYYSAKTAQLPPVCFHCGGVSGASLANDADIQELQKLHSVLRPICTFCKAAGKITSNPRNQIS